MELHILSPQFSGDPEALAMLQAFYSRSAESIVSRVERLGKDLTSVKAALNKFYIGYGHQSIGDCGTVTVFVENVSILAAKALQENPLYNGQECSTRYIELSGKVYRESDTSSSL
jgi:thymidylate synthase ThyX